MSAPPVNSVVTVYEMSIGACKYNASSGTYTAQLTNTTYNVLSAEIVALSLSPPSDGFAARYCVASFPDLPSGNTDSTSRGPFRGAACRVPLRWRGEGYATASTHDRGLYTWMRADYEPGRLPPASLRVDVARPPAYAASGSLSTLSIAFARWDGSRFWTGAETTPIFWSAQVALTTSAPAPAVVPRPQQPQQPVPAATAPVLVAPGDYDGDTPMADPSPPPPVQLTTGGSVPGGAQPAQPQPASDSAFFVPSLVGHMAGRMRRPYSCTSFWSNMR